MKKKNNHQDGGIVQLPHDPNKYHELNEIEKEEMHDTILGALEPFFKSLHTPETDRNERDS